MSHIYHIHVYVISHVQIYLWDDLLRVELLCQRVCTFEVLVAVTKLLFREVVLMYMLITVYEGVQFPILFPA